RADSGRTGGSRVMKIAVSGKGGSGKTTITAVFAFLLRDMGRRVLAVDADPDANLALTLGFPDPGAIKPISEMKNLIRERTETDGESSGMFFKMNPRVDDVPDSLGAEHEGIRLIHLGAIRKGGGGCACPENVFMRALLSHLILERDDAVLVDMPAGVEHLGRGTAAAVDLLLAVTEPSPQSIQTTHRIRALAADLKIKNVRALGNKVRDENDRKFIAGNSPLETLGYLPFDPSLAGTGALNPSATFVDEARMVLYKMDGVLTK
ncbi:MAG: AAA family ATPase, partial [bacterium]